MRWDRVGRLALCAVLAVIVYLYVTAGVSLWSAWRTSNAAGAKALALRHENVVLRRSHAALGKRGGTEVQARRLGMNHPGEEVFVVEGLPRN